jgi:uncharacterized protein (TIGR02145 family)
MKKRIQNYIAVVIMMAIFMSLATGCKKETEDPVSPDQPVQIPKLETIAISDVAESGASYVGIVTSDGGAEITAYGVCWSTDKNPTINDYKSTAEKSTGSFTGNISGLSAGQLYFVRLYATNSAGTGYSNEQSFRTTTSAVTDIDGNVYHTVTIGTQVWMVENLKVTKYRDGTPIRQVNDHDTWLGINDYGAYCDYNNDEDKSLTYGHLYNWYAATDSRNIAPEGWHVPSFNEFVILLNSLGGSKVAGGKLKEAGLAHWLSPNIGATNESGFNAIPGGVHNAAGFDLLGGISSWWTTTESDNGSAYTRYVLYYDDSFNTHIVNKLFGNSIRCVKD